MFAVPILGIWVSVSNAKQDLVVAAMIAPEDRQIRKLKGIYLLRDVGREMHWA